MCVNNNEVATLLLTAFTLGGYFAITIHMCLNSHIFHNSGNEATIVINRYSKHSTGRVRIVHVKYCYFVCCIPSSRFGVEPGPTAHDLVFVV